MLLNGLAYSSIRDIDAVIFAQRLEYVVFALQNQQLNAIFIGLERYLHKLVEEFIVPLAHGFEKLHILNAAVYHRAAVRRNDAVGKVEAALNSALQKCP